MSEAIIVRERFSIDADHASLPGHFPGNPVVPGVVLLDRIAAAIERAGAGTLRRIGAVKFLAPVLPGEDVECVVARDGERVRFHAMRDGTTVLRGDGVLA